MNICKKALPYRLGTAILQPGKSRNAYVDSGN